MYGRSEREANALQDGCSCLFIAVRQFAPFDKMTPNDVRARSIEAIKAQKENGLYGRLIREQHLTNGKNMTLDGIIHDTASGGWGGKLHVRAYAHPCRVLAPHTLSACAG